MPEQYNFMGGVGGQNLGVYEQATQRMAASRDPYYQLNTAIKQHELEAARWTMHEKAYNMQRQVLQKHGMAELSGIMVQGAENPQFMLRNILQTANRYGLDDDQIKTYVDLAKQMENRHMTMMALQSPAPEGMQRDVSFTPSGMSVSFKEQSQNNATEIWNSVWRMREQAEAARAAGDTRKYQELSAKANELASSAPGGGESISMGYDDGGRQIFSVSRGRGNPLTVGTQSNIQQSYMAFESGLEMLNQLDRVMKPDQVGIPGKIGDVVFDSVLANWFPGVANEERIDTRTLIGNVRERLLRAFAADARISNQDAERMLSFLPSDEALTSFPKEKQKIVALRKSIRTIGKNYALMTGDPIPLSVMEVGEIQEHYQRRAAEIDRQVASMQMDEEQGRRAKQAEYMKAEQALTKFH